MDANNWIALAGLTSGTIAFGVGLAQYRMAQRWKRAEFAAREFKEMLADPEVAIALRLLDWNSAHYDLSDDGKYPTLNDVAVDDSMLARALEPHVRRPNGYSPAEARLREAMDALLGHLQGFEHFIEAGLIRVDDFRPYLRYWMTLIGDPAADRKPAAVLQAIWQYVEYYGYTDVQRLCGRFGHDIRRLQPAAPAAVSARDARLPAAPTTPAVPSAAARGPDPRRRR